jgi:hypothetical protein
MPETMTQSETKQKSRVMDQKSNRQEIEKLDTDLLRRLDWRFMLADLSLQRIVYFGKINTQLYQALHAITKTMIINPPGYQEYEIPVKEPFIVVLAEDKKTTFRKALSWVFDSNTLYWESDPEYPVLALLRNMFGIYPCHYRYKINMLKAHDLQSASAFLHWPSVKDCREFIPLDTPLVKDRFTKYAKGKMKRILGWLIDLVFKTRVYKYFILSYSIIGRQHLIYVER